MKVQRVRAPKRLRNTDIDGLATTERVASASYVSNNDNNSMQNLDQFVQESCNNTCEEVTLDNEADEQHFSRDTEADPIRLVDLNSSNNNTSEENSDTDITESLNASKNNKFPTTIENAEIKREIIAAGPKQPQGPFPTDPLQNGRSFYTNY